MKRTLRIVSGSVAATLLFAAISTADDDTLRDLGASAAPGEIAKFDGTQWRAAHDDITQVNAGPGLTGGGSNLVVTLSADFGDDGSSEKVSRADHSHFGLSPVGTVQAWLKSYPNVPALPKQWVECNGQVLNDPESPFNGQTLPDLNGSTSGTNRFLVGGTASGETGGSETHDHGGHTGTTGGNEQPYGLTGNITGPHNHTINEDSNLPPFYRVVWIMRVK